MATCQATQARRAHNLAHALAGAEEVAQADCLAPDVGPIDRWTVEIVSEADGVRLKTMAAAAEHAPDARVRQADRQGRQRVTVVVFPR
jgi:hypothetical protein